MIKTFLKKLLPLPAQKTHERFNVLQDRLAELDVLAKKLDALGSMVTDANNDIARRITDANRDVNRQLDDTGQLLLKEIQYFMGMWQEEVVAGRERATSSYMYSYIN